VPALRLKRQTASSIKEALDQWMPLSSSSRHKPLRESQSNPSSNSNTLAMQVPFDGKSSLQHHDSGRRWCSIKYIGEEV